MTEFLEKAIASVRQLTESEQDGIAAMILQELEKKQVVAWDDFDQIMQVMSSIMSTTPSK